MELRQLEILRAVAETRNFTRAGERLGLTQSAVSQQIKALEEELGEPLLVRTSKRVEVSRGGEKVLEHAEQIFAKLREIRGTFKGTDTLAASRLRVAVATQALVHLFSPICAEFIRRYPQVELFFRTTANTNETIKQIRSNTADVGFASLPIRSRELKVERLFDDELVLTVSRAHGFAKRAFVEANDLTGQRFILYEQNVSVRQVTDTFFQHVAIEPVVAAESNDTDFILQMVAENVGIAFLPAWAVADELHKNRVRAITVSNHPLRRSVAICHLKSNPSAAVRVFLSFLRQHREAIQRAAQPEIIHHAACHLAKPRRTKS
jgi:DNA-binding transcriptional LysR family regulator